MRERRGVAKVGVRSVNGRGVMKNKQQLSEEQILAVLREAEAGATIEEVCSRHGISSATLAKWRSEHGAPGPLDARRLKQLEEENRRLRSLVADLTLSNQALKLAVSKKW
jgi:putative transposase